MTHSARFEQIFGDAVGDVQDFFQHIAGVFDAVGFLLAIGEERGRNQSAEQQQSDTDFHWGQPFSFDWN